MQPRSIRSKENLPSPRSLHGLNDVIETTDSSCIRVDIRITNKLIHHALVRLPVIAKTTKGRDDEIHIRIFGSQHLHDLSLTDHIHKEWDAKCSRCLADFPGRHGVV